MTKIISNTARKSSVATVSVQEMTPEYLATLVYQKVKITGGRKFPLETVAEVLKAGISARWNRPYAMIRIGNEDHFCDPKHLKIVGKLPEAERVALEAEMETERDSTTLVKGRVRNETEKAINFDHDGWYSPVWMPISFAERMTDADENGYAIYRFPTWKLVSLKRDMEKLEARQDEWQAECDEHDAAESARLTAKPATTLVKANVAAKLGIKK